MRKSKKIVAILATLALLATLLVPMVGPASAAATYSTGTVVKANAGESQDLGSLKISVPAAELNPGDYLTLRLPSDFKYNLPTGVDLNLVLASGDIYNLTVASDVYSNVQIRIPQIKNAFGSNFYNNIKAQALTNNELKLTFTNTTNMASGEDTAYLYLLFKNVYVASGFSGSVDVALEGKSGSPFVDGKVTIAQVGAGIVTLTMDGVKDITTSLSDIDNLRLKEDRPGAFDQNQTVKLKLPNGFKWDITKKSVAVLDGNVGTNWVSLDATQDDGRTLVITSTAKTTKAAYILIGGLQVKIADETIAKAGDVLVTVSGTATTTPDSLLVARYGQFSAKIYLVGDPPVVMAGRTGAKSDTYVEIGKFAIEEAIKKSLMKDRTITLTLSGGAKWVKDSSGYVKDVTIDTADSKNYSGVLRTDWEVIGTAGDTARITVKGESSDAAKIVYKNAKISVAANASGDIKMTVGGTAGVTGEFVVAKAMKPVTATVDGTVPNIVIGAQNSAIPAIIVSENVAEAINRGKLSLRFPLDVLPSMPSKVTVVEGDLSIDPNSIARSVTADGRWSVDVTVKATSSVPSKIKFEGIKLTLARTVPEGDLNASVVGDAVVQNAGPAGKGYPEDFPGYTSVATAKVANVVTPAPGEQKATVAFKIGDTKYTVNGVEQTMDVAPYIKDGRTFVPVRYAAQAVGVTPENILYADGKVTLIKGDKVVQLTIGSNVMVINGIGIAMDVAAELKDGRTMLPFRWVAQALGAKVNWDEATQTVTMEL